MWLTHAQVVTKLHSILKPFLLRRVKTDVESALPGKLEVVLYAPMTPTQRKLNDQLLKTTLQVRRQAGLLRLMLWSSCAHTTCSAPAGTCLPMLAVRLQDKDLNKSSGASQGVSRLNNMLMQMRKVRLSFLAFVFGHDIAYDTVHHLS